MTSKKVTTADATDITDDEIFVLAVTRLDSGEDATAESLSTLVVASTPADRAPAAYLRSNAGLMMIATWAREGTDGSPFACSVKDACADLDCEPSDLRDAVIEAYPAAADWDWA